MTKAGAPRPWYRSREVVSWALYDWANSAFATTVIAGFFPVFFKQYWSAGADAGTSTFQLGIANSLASLIIVILAPILGAIADRGSAKKKFLIFFASMGILMTGLLHLVQHGQWVAAVMLYIFATIGFSGANIFYDSLIISVAEEKKVDLVSALGFSLGYLGGGLIFGLNVWMASAPATFGFDSAEQAVRLSFILVAVWWAVFSIPVMLFVHEPKIPGARLGFGAVAAGFRQVVNTFHEVRRLRYVFLFLIAYWLYIDGVDTIVRMAVDYGMSLGFDSNSLVLALLITQFVGFPAAIAFGKLGEKIGAKRGILIGIAVYLGICVWGYLMERTAEFYAIAVVVGLVQGGVQALSRSFYTRLIPRDKAAEFFGFYNMLGKFAAVIGPVMMGWVSVVTGNPRLSILSVAILFIAGAGLLYFVDETAGRAAARELEKT